MIPAAPAARPLPGRPSAVAGAVFALLVVATFLALFYAQELKHQDPLIKGARPVRLTFRPSGPGVRHAHFDVRTSVNDRLDVQIVSERAGRTVRTIPLRAHAYIHVPVTWDGRTDAGAAAAPGTYLVRVHLERWDRTVPLRRIVLHLEGPAA